MDSDTLIERRVFAKTAWRLIPLIALSYLIAYVDRSNLNFASVSMNADLGFSQAVYGAGAAIFFAGYSLFEVPSNLMLVRFGARRWLARIMATWGLVSMAMIFVHAPWHFYVLRFLLGVAEAGFFPGVAHYLADWMPARRRARAISLFYIASPAGSVVMGALATPLLGLNGALGLAGWQWLLLIEGAPAVLMAALLLVALPDRPSDVAWLSAPEKTWLIETLASDARASGPANGSLRAALANPMVLAIGLADALAFGVHNAIGFSVAKMMISAGGLSMAQAGMTATVTGLATIGAMLVMGRVGDRARNPFAVKALLTAIAAAGVGLMIVSGRSVLLPIGYGIFATAALTASMFMAILVSRFVHPSGRAAGLAMANSIAQLGGFTGLLLWGFAADRTGGFGLGLAVACPAMLVAAGTILVAGRLRQRRATPLALAAA